MSRVITNRMDRPWSFAAPGYVFSFTLAAKEMRILSDEEYEAVKANKTVQKFIDSGLLIMYTGDREDPGIDTVAETQKKAKRVEKSDVMKAASGRKAATVKTEIKGTTSVAVGTEE